MPPEQFGELLLMLGIKTEETNRRCVAVETNMNNFSKICHTVNEAAMFSII